jgi:AraC-like DNA-binding protein
MLRERSDCDARGPLDFDARQTQKIGDRLSMPDRRKSPGTQNASLMKNQLAHHSGNEVHHYLPIPDDVFHSGFYITSLGHSTIAPRSPYPPAQHPALYHFEWRDGRVLPEFALVLISAGGGTFESKETGEVVISPGMAMLLPPAMWHRYRPNPATGWTETWMQFNGEFAHLLLAQGFISPRQSVLHGPHLMEIVSKLCGLLANVHASPTSNTLLVSLQGLSVLGLALRIPEPATGTNDPLAKGADPVVSAALEYIWSRSHQVLSVTDVADAIGVTRRMLERRMIAVTGHTALDAIIDCRFSRAERLLRETDLPVKAVASLAGFGSLQNLRHVCLQRLGRAPGVYRDRHRPE